MQGRHIIGSILLMPSFLLTSPPPARAGVLPREPVEIGSEPQFFVDRRKPC